MVHHRCTVIPLGYSPEENVHHVVELLVMCCTDLHHSGMEHYPMECLVHWGRLYFVCTSELMIRPPAFSASDPTNHLFKPSS